MLGYLNGGFQHLINALGGAIRRKGGHIHEGQAIERIHMGHRPALRVNGVREEFDRLIFTVNVDRLADLCDEISPPFLQECSAIQYMGVVCLVLMLRKPLGKMYWLNITDPQFPFGGIIEHTRLVGPEHYGGRHIAYIFRYLPSGHPFLALEAQPLLELFYPSIRAIYPHFSRHDVEHLYLFKTPYATPIYQIGYRRKWEVLNRGLGTLSFATMAQVYPFDRNMSHCIGVARDTARRIGSA